jgi:hypothetical protein
MYNIIASLDSNVNVTFVYPYGSEYHGVTRDYPKNGRRLTMRSGSEWWPEPENLQKFEALRVNGMTVVQWPKFVSAY